MDKQKWLKFIAFLIVILTITILWIELLMIKPKSSVRDEVQMNNSKSDEQFCTVDTNSGRIQGKINRTLFENVPYYSFRGIPYAKPPIGNLRFKAPKRIKPWNNTFDAFDFGNNCIQFRINYLFLGSEDCLYLNVFVPAECSKINSNNKYPVMVFIHGGAFMIGGSSFYGPDFFMEENVIIVTLNYRLSIFGFLSLGLPEYSGNMGLKDQKLALQWISENIEQFGGDKNNVTLFGHSAGAISANLHFIAQQKDKMYQKAIMMCGSALMPLVPGPINHQSVIEYIGKKVNHSISNVNDSINFLSQIDAKLLTLISIYNLSEHELSPRLIFFMWSPCIENKDAIDPFMTESPFDMLTNPSYHSDIDTLYAVSPKEFSITLKNISAKFREHIEKFEIELPLSMARIDFKSAEYQNISKRMRDFYFDGKPITEDNVDKLSALISDTEFLYGISLSARFQSRKSTGRTYFSIVSAKTNWALSKRNSLRRNITSSSAHIDILAYIFRYTEVPNILADTEYQSLGKTSLETQLIKNTTKFLVNFAKFGNPIPNSEPFYYLKPNSNHYNAYNISTEGIHIKEGSIFKGIAFWDKVLDDYKYLWNRNYSFSHNEN